MLGLICQAAPVFRDVFENRYEEWCALFDWVAAMLEGEGMEEERGGEAERKVGKAASDALLLVYTRATF
jgi:hypothetical protein